MLFLGCGALLRYGALGRPESLVVAPGFNSFVVLAASAGRARPTGYPAGTAQLVGAGVLAGAATLAHLNGLVFIGAGAGWLLRPGRGLGWRPALLFGVVGGGVAALYLVDAVAAGKLPTLLWQFRHAPATRHSFTLETRLLILRGLHRLFLHSEGEAARTVLSVLGAIGLRRYGGVRAGYALLLAPLFCLLTKNAADYYFLLFISTLVAALTDWLEPIAVHPPRRLAWMVRGLLVVYVLLLLPRAGWLRRQQRLFPANTVVRNETLAGQMPRRGARVIAPLDFFFGQVGNYRIRGLPAYALRNTREWHDTLSVRGFFGVAVRFS